MYKFIRKTSFMLILILLSVKVIAADLNVFLSVSPPYTPYVSDYFSLQSKTIVTISNPNRTEYRIKIAGKIEGDNGVVLSTSSSYIPPNPIIVPAFGTVTIFGNQLERYFDINTINIQGIKKTELTAGGGLPEGNYKICIQAFDYDNSTPRSAEDPVGCSNTFTVQQIEPPFTILPGCGEVIPVLRPQNVVFTWTTPSKISNKTKYLLKIVELPNTSRNAGNALQNVTVPPFFEKILTTNSYIYGISDPIMQVGKKYAYSITAFESEQSRTGQTLVNNIAFRNNGQSEPCMFFYGVNPDESTPETKLVVAKDINLKGINFSPNITFQPLPISFIKGKIEYAFYKEEENESLGLVAEFNTPPTIINTTMPSKDFFSLSNSIQDYSQETSSSTGNNTPATTQGNYSASTVYGANGSFNVNEVPNTNFELFINNQHNKTDYWLESQKSLALEAGSKRYPLSNQSIELRAFLKEETMAYYQKLKQTNLNVVMPKNDLLLGTTQTDVNGNYSLMFYKNDIDLAFYDIELTIKNDKQFYLPPIPVSIIATEEGTYDMGSILCLANTYRLKVNVIGGNGLTLTGATIKILRADGFYNNKAVLKPEGNRNGSNADTKVNTKKSDLKPTNNNQATPYTLQSYNGLEVSSQNSSFELVGEIKGGKTQKRLFEGIDNSEVYYLHIEAQDHYPITTPLIFIPGHNFVTSSSSVNAKIQNSILEVTGTFNLQLEPSSVKGRLVDKDKEVVIPNQTVTLYSKKDNKLVYTTKSDNDGRFIIKNVITSSEPYYIKIDGDVVKNFEYSEPISIAAEGTKVNIDPLYVSAQLFPITGIVSDEEGIPISNAELKWKSGGKSFYTNGAGLYIGYNVGGKHKLIVKKPGFRSKEIEVTLKLPEEKSTGLILYGDIKVNGTTALLNQFGNIQAKAQDGINFSNIEINKNFKKEQPKQKFDPISSLELLDMNPINIGDLLLNNDQDNAPTITLDTIKLSRFIVKVKVLDNISNAVIANAKIIANQEENKPSLTGINGITLVKNATEGSTTLLVYGPEGVNYVPQSITLAVNPANDTTYVEVVLKSGSELSGIVTSAGSKLKNAQIYLEGKDYIKTSSDDNGNYKLYVSEGEYNVIASKVGLLADKKIMTFVNSSYTQNFDLKDPGFDASKLLGFDLVLLESIPTGIPNEFKISGSLVNIPSNGLFTINASKKLDFFDCIIVKQGNSISPKSGSVKLVETNLTLNLWDYLKLTLKSPSGISVIPLNGDITKGVINGEMEINVLESFTTNYGIKWPSGKYLISEDGIQSTMNAFYSQNPANVLQSLKLKAPTSGWEVHGVIFTPDYSKTKISKGGIEFGGTLQIKDIPGLGNANLILNTLKIGTNGDIKNIDISVNPTPKLQLGSWALNIQSASINQYGFKFGGNAVIPIPASNNAIFSFNNVNLNKSGINGGTYALSAPINIFDAVKFSGSISNPLSFSKIPGLSHYKISGGGKIELPKFISKAINIDNLVVGTNGEFGLSCSPNFEVEFAGLAALKIKKFNLYPTQKEFAIDGGFRLNIPGVGAEAGGFLHYKPGSVWLDKLNIGASMGGVGGFSAAVDFSENTGFKGKGNINIVSLLSMGMEFNYLSNNQGKTIKAAISTGVTLPIGVVTFENIGGGFLYSSIDKKYGINLTGRMTLAPGTSALVALDNISIGVYVQQGGPVFDGSAIPKVVTMDVGLAQFKLDIPNKNFFINAELKNKMQIFPGLSFDAAGGFMLAASAKPSDQYWLVGVYTRLKMLGLIDENMNITGAWNLNRTNHPEFNDYTLFIPSEYLNSGKINGFNARFSSLKGVKPENKKCGGVSDIAELCMYAYADMDISLYSNFVSNTYGLGLSQKWGAGGSADFFGIGLAGADISVGYNLSGGYSGGNFFIKGNGNASAKAYIGCSGSGCSNGLSWGCCFNACLVGCRVCPCPCGGRICLSPSVGASYYSNTGKFDVNINW